MPLPLSSACAKVLTDVEERKEVREVEERCDVGTSRWLEGDVAGGDGGEERESVAGLSGTIAGGFESVNGWTNGLGVGSTADSSTSM